MELLWIEFEFILLYVKWEILYVKWVGCFEDEWCCLVVIVVILDVNMCFNVVYFFIKFFKNVVNIKKEGD